MSNFVGHMKWRNSHPNISVIV